MMNRSLDINILLDVKEDFIVKAKYVFDIYCDILGLEPHFFYGKTAKNIDIYYGSDFKPIYPLCIYHNKDTSSFFQKRETYPEFEVRFNNYKNEKIPFLFSKPGKIFYATNNTGRIYKDIIASGFYFLSCWQEHIHSQNSDPAVRFNFKDSLQYQWDFADVPVVDAYCDIFGSILDITIIQDQAGIKWQHKKDFCVTLSHDIDYWNFWDKDHLKKTNRYNRKRLKSNFTRSMYKLVAHNMTKHNSNPEKNMINIIRKESKLKVRSTNFLIVADKSDDERRSYFAKDNYRNQIKHVFTGYDVGLHGSPESAYETEQAQDELDRLKTLFLEPAGYRSHKLSFEYYKTFDILVKMNIKYDSSLGYWEHIGFRAGISFPFKPFNIEEDRSFKIIEIPLVVMETSMLSHLGMNMTAIQSYQRLKRLIKSCKKFNSHISILWHNNTFDSVDYPLWGELYWQIIKYAQKENGWVCSLDELYEFWIHKNERQNNIK